MDYNNSKNGKLTAEAEAWIVKLHADDVSRAEKARFSRWLNTSAEHIDAFDEALSDWEKLGAACQVNEQLDEHAPTSAASTTDGFLKPDTSSPDITMGHRANAWWHILFRPAFAVAAVCLVVIIGFGGNFLVSDEAPPTVRYASQIGETQTVKLDDGSQIELNTASIIEVRFSEKRRDVALVQGEAYFSVAKDRDRPFIVEFGDGSATAVGTAFAVYRDTHSSSITVTEGIVDVRENAELAIPHPDPVRIIRNQQVRVGRKGVSPVRMINPSRTLAWRDKTIIFKDTPLDDALNELNRYLEQPAVAEEISNLRISGTFSLSSPDETLDAIIAAFDLHSRTSASDNSLYLRPE